MPATGFQVELFGCRDLGAASVGGPGSAHLDPAVEVGDDLFRVAGFGERIGGNDTMSASFEPTARVIARHGWLLQQHSINLKENDFHIAALQSIEGFAQVISGAQGAPPARIVLMTDGKQTVPTDDGDDPREVLRRHTTDVMQASEDFYALPPITDYRLDADQLTWTSAVQTPSPENNIARGRFFPGSRISPAVNVTLFHADCANSGPTIARPSIISSASTSKPSPAGSNHTCDADGFQPFSHDAHHDEV